MPRGPRVCDATLVERRPEGATVLEVRDAGVADGGVECGGGSGEVAADGTVDGHLVGVRRLALGNRIKRQVSWVMGASGAWGYSMRLPKRCVGSWHLPHISLFRTFFDFSQFVGKQWDFKQR